MYYVYVLESQTSGRLYIGQTNNLKNRLVRHNGNRVRSTKNRGPWILVGYLQVESRAQSMALEKYLKSLKSPTAVKSYLNKNALNA